MPRPNRVNSWQGTDPAAPPGSLSRRPGRRCIDTQRSSVAVLRRSSPQPTHTAYVTPLALGMGWLR
jgi:hypothetical protein